MSVFIKISEELCELLKSVSFIVSFSFSVFLRIETFASYTLGILCSSLSRGKHYAIKGKSHSILFL